MVKSTKASAQTLYLMGKNLEDHTKSSKEQIEKYWDNSKNWAAKFLQSVYKAEEA